MLAFIAARMTEIMVTSGAINAKNSCQIITKSTHPFNLIFHRIKIAQDLFVPQNIEKFYQQNKQSTYKTYRNLHTSKSRRSPGTLSPILKYTMSPGTSSRAKNVSSFPFRMLKHIRRQRFAGSKVRQFNISTSLEDKAFLQRLDAVIWGKVWHIN